MNKKLFLSALVVLLVTLSTATAQEPKPPRIVSWSNSKTGDQKTIFAVKPGEKITFTVKADGAEKFVWLVDGVIQEEAERDSFKWVVPNKRGMWKVLVKTSNTALEKRVRQEQEALKGWKENFARRKWKDKCIQDMIDLSLYPSEARKEWVVAAVLKKADSGRPVRRAVESLPPVGPASTTGWESEKSLVEGIQPRRGRGITHTCPALAFDVMGDGKWVLICGSDRGSLYGYYWDGRKWVADKARVKGLKARGSYCAPVFLHNFTGDGKWTFIISNQNKTDNFSGYYWDGSQWVSDPARVKGLGGVAVPWRGAFTVLKNLKGDGKWTLISGSRAGTFTGFCWDGDKWVPDASRAAGLGSAGGRSKPAAGFDVFGDKKWILIVGNQRGTYSGYFWDGNKWVSDKARVAGLGDARKYQGNTAPALAYNLRGDKKWVLTAGHYLAKIRGFFCNTVAKADIPPVKDVTLTPFATAAYIKWKYEKAWNHRVRYSTSKDMSGAVWSDWCEDSKSVDVTLKNLQPETTYYYQAFTCVPWNTDAHARTTVGSFTTPPGQACVRLKPGESIRDAMYRLSPEGGIIELLPGKHEIHKTIVIDRNNVVIYGARRSVILKSGVTCFYLTDLYPKSPVANITFRGFTVEGGRGSLVRGKYIKNLVVEDIHDNSSGGNLVSITRWHNPRNPNVGLYCRNNVSKHNSIYVNTTDNLTIPLPACTANSAITTCT